MKGLMDNVGNKRTRIIPDDVQCTIRGDHVENIQKKNILFEDLDTFELKSGVNDRGLQICKDEWMKSKCKEWLEEIKPSLEECWSKCKNKKQNIAENISFCDRDNFDTNLLCKKDEPTKTKLDISYKMLSAPKDNIENFEQAVVKDLINNICKKYEESEKSSRNYSSPCQKEPTLAYSTDNDVNKQFPKQELMPNNICSPVANFPTGLTTRVVPTFVQRSCLQPIVPDPSIIPPFNACLREHVVYDTNNCNVSNHCSKKSSRLNAASESHESIQLVIVESPHNIESDNSSSSHTKNSAKKSLQKSDRSHNLSNSSFKKNKSNTSCSSIEKDDSEDKSSISSKSSDKSEESDSTHCKEESKSLEKSLSKHQSSLNNEKIASKNPPSNRSNHSNSEKTKNSVSVSYINGKSLARSLKEKSLKSDSKHESKLNSISCEQNKTVSPSGSEEQSSQQKSEDEKSDISEKLSSKASASMEKSLEKEKSMSEQMRKSESIKKSSYDEKEELETLIKKYDKNKNIGKSGYEKILKDYNNLIKKIEKKGLKNLLKTECSDIKDGSFHSKSVSQRKVSENDAITFKNISEIPYLEDEFCHEKPKKIKANSIDKISNDFNYGHKQNVLIQTVVSKINQRSVKTGTKNGDISQKTAKEIQCDMVSKNHGGSYHLVESPRQDKFVSPMAQNQHKVTLINELKNKFENNTKNFGLNSKPEMINYCHGGNSKSIRNFLNVQNHNEAIEHTGDRQNHVFKTENHMQFQFSYDQQANLSQQPHKNNQFFQTHFTPPKNFNLQPYVPQNNQEPQCYNNQYPSNISQFAPIPENVNIANYMNGNAFENLMGNVNYLATQPFEHYKNIQSYPSKPHRTPIITNYLPHPN